MTQIADVLQKQQDMMDEVNAAGLKRDQANERTDKEEAKKRADELPS